MSSADCPMARLRLDGRVVKSIKLVDNDFVVATTDCADNALLMPLQYAVAAGTFLKLLNYNVALEEMP